ncbi:MAG: peptide chain release factor N(5)-glutamine methyltransferase [Bacteroidaceae bacterium]|nr:peptide chain release factor N(5)-glutamine methyltransferase [Bacteroidaceae bacterium]
MENAYTLYLRLLAALRPHYEAGEARAIALLALEDGFGWSRTDVYAGKIKPFPPADAQKFGQMLQRLSEGEPVQYVVGRARFLGRDFTVRRGVLIPRPETEELVEWVAHDLAATPHPRIVDCGTGSGCIAVSLKLLLPEAEVEAWDTSETALDVARENAARLGADVAFHKKDLAELPAEAARFDVAVSNPPYVRLSERGGMAPHVLGHEPSEALFVADADPLVHYRALAASRLPLYLEINAALADETQALLARAGYASVTLRADRYGRPRMVKAIP